MTTPAKAKGGKYEREVLAWLRGIFGQQVDRSSANKEAVDFFGTPVPVQAKHRHRWDIKQWARELQELTTRPVMADELREVPPGPTGQWLLVVADGDRRRADAVPDLVIMPRSFATSVLRAWYEHQCNRCIGGGDAEA
jgi:hypothetical protein